jgi:hypothetical protein
MGALGWINLRLDCSLYLQLISISKSFGYSTAYFSFSSFFSPGLRVSRHLRRPVSLSDLYKNLVFRCFLTKLYQIRPSLSVLCFELFQLTLLTYNKCQVILAFTTFKYLIGLMRDKHAFILWLLFLTLASCTYSPDDEFFKEIEEPSTDGINPSLQDVLMLDVNDNKDTVAFFTYTTFRINFDLSDRTLFSVDLKLNGQSVLITTLKEDYLRFQVNPAELGSGYHNLVIELVFTSGSGSLADKNQLEYQNISRKWVLHADLDPPNQLSIQNVALENGWLKVSWKKYTRINFKSYRIIRYFEEFPGSDNLKQSGSWVIFDKNMTDFIDAGYLQGKVAYVISVSNTTNQARSSERSEIFELPNKSDISIQTLNDGSHILNWQTPYLTNPFDQYQIYISQDNSSASSTEIASINDINETSFRYNSGLKFGSEFKYQVFVRGKLIPSAGNAREINARVGLKIPSFKEAEASKTAEAVFFNIDETQDELGRIVKLDLLGLQREDSIFFNDLPDMNNDEPHHLILTPDGNRLFVLNKALIHELDLNDLNVINSYNLQSLLGGPLFSTLEHNPNRISNNGILLIKIGAVDHLIDLVSSQILFQSSYSSTIAALSPNGEWFVDNDYSYKRVGNTFVEHKFIQRPNITALGFMSNGLDFFQYETLVNGAASSSVYVSNLESFDLEQEIDASALGVNLASQNMLNFDKYSKSYYTVGSASQPFVYSISAEDLTSGQLPILSNSGVSFYLAGDFIFSNDGYYMKYR